MDTSETYIKMRLAAKKELLDGIPPDISIPVNSERGLYVETQKWVSDNVFVDIKGDFYYSTDTGHCQLERQDQLQEIVRQPSLPWMLRNASDFVFDHDMRFGPLLTFTSMEQLWLAFVMKEKYNKVWNGEGWVEGIASASTGLSGWAHTFK